MKYLLLIVSVLFLACKQEVTVEQKSQWVADATTMANEAELKGVRCLEHSDKVACTGYSRNGVEVIACYLEGGCRFLP
jgi:hypothetical protein